jgi:hypothetical protein
VRVLVLLLVLSTVILAACDGTKLDRTLGARCQDQDDCAARCLGPSPTYPGGLCTTGCTGDGDCSREARCVAEEGGVCLYACRDDADCTLLGEGTSATWVCKEIPRFAAVDGGPVVTVRACQGES